MESNSSQTTLWKRWSWVFLFVALFASSAFAQIPRVISYQGVLTDASGNPRSDGNYSFIFSLYETSTGGTAIWSESKTLNVSKGLFSTFLGDKTSFSDTLKFDKPYWLGIKVGSDAELSPRIALTTAGYSFSSINSDTTQNIIDGKVVKSLNGLKDDVQLVGTEGTIVNTSGNTITISGGSSGSGGIQEIVNSNNTLDVSNPKGPTTTLNLKVPLKLSANVPDTVFSSNAIGSGIGITGRSTGSSLHYDGVGIYGESTYGIGVRGYSKYYIGILGESDTSTGVWGESSSGDGVYGSSLGSNGLGVHGSGTIGVYGRGYQYGIEGITDNPNAYGGVYGNNANSPGAYGLLGAYKTGVYGYGATGNTAGIFIGNVTVTGSLLVNGTIAAGTKSFKIDDPLDPANKYLIHSCVESPDRMDIYNGNIITDASGLATIKLPAYFQALNIDYRYQLTVIGQFAQAIVETKIQNNRFTIKTDKPDVEVSWQVTGIRNDAYAKAHPMVVEQEKEGSARGKYIHPELYGQPEEDAINYVKPSALQTKNR